MCRWLVYTGDNRQIEEIIYDQPRSLVHQSMYSLEAKLGVHGDGVGLGWYGNHKSPGLYRDPAPAWNNHNLKELSRQIDSHLFFAHIRASTGGASVHLNCHPFRVGHWLFMHNGQVGDFHRIHFKLLNMLSEEYFHYRTGNTDSELMFLLAMQFKFKDNPKSAMAKMFSTVLETCELEGITKPIHATMALSNGQSTWIVRFSSDNKSPSLYIKEERDYCLVVSEPLDGITDDWESIEENSFITITRGNTGETTRTLEKFI